MLAIAQCLSITYDNFTFGALKWGGTVYENQLILDCPDALYAYIEMNKIETQYEKYNAYMMKSKCKYEPYTQSWFSHHAHFNFGNKLAAVAMMAIQYSPNANDLMLAEKMHEIQSQKFTKMYQAILEGKIVIINQKGGYFTSFSNNDYELIKTIKLTHQQVYEWIWSNAKVDIPLNTKQSGEYLLVQERSGRIHYDNCAIGINSHAQLCEYRRLCEDNVMKYSFDPRDKSNCEYGIPGLRKSFVYDNNPDIEPFETKKYHVDRLETLVKELESSHLQ
jgi:hypothetical protein